VRARLFHQREAFGAFKKSAAARQILFSTTSQQVLLGKQNAILDSACRAKLLYSLGFARDRNKNIIPRTVKIYSPHAQQKSYKKLLIYKLRFLFTRKT